MTNIHNTTDNRDEVLFAFDQACSSPTAAQIIEWCERFPQFADDIRAHAAILRDLAARAAVPAAKANDTMLARGFSRVLNLLFEAERAVNASSDVQSFEQVMQARGTDTKHLARTLDIARGVLADLFSGRMLVPAGKQLVAAFIHALDMTPQQFAAAHDLALRTPSAAHAKATQTPTAAPRSYEAIIRDSGMSDERKQYWLAED
jgi:hypothetical protein